MRRMSYLISSALLATLAPALQAAEQGEPIGTAGAVTPSAKAILASEERALARDVEVRFGETISTTTKGNAGLIFEDQTRLFVAENSRIEIDAYVFGGQGRIDLKLLKGVLRLASGRIGGENIKINTPVAYLGLRGTVVSVGTDANRTVIYVEDGTVDVEAGGQTITVDEGQSLVVERDDPGTAESGWPTDLNTAVATMSAQLATVAPVALSIPVETTNNLNANSVNNAAQDTPSSDSGYNYN